MDKTSLAHTKWECKYYLVFAPKYRRQVIYGKIKADIGRILRELCERKGVEIIEAECCPDHIHMLVRIPPEIQRIRNHGISEREKFADHIRSTCKSEIQIWKPPFLVPRILCGYSRKK